MINVTKTFLPPFEEYQEYLKQAWDRAWITNNGPLVQQLEKKLQSFLGVDNLLFASSGTIVLQMALKTLKKGGEVITTPFSYVATCNAILWEGHVPVFADIDSKSFCIDTQKIEELITEKTTAILATHVFGVPCDVEAIEAIAKKHNLIVIYDGAHAFGTEYKGQQLLSYGDITTCSFHATKLFHTVEGGCIIGKDPEILRELFLMRSFGHIGDEYFSVGINGKNSEFHAAMGLANLPHIEDIICRRKAIHGLYIELLGGLKLQFLEFNSETVSFNYAYFPVVFKSERDLLNVREVLLKNDITTRRYFYPSLNQLPFVENSNSCPISEDISKRILCLPLFADLDHEDVKRISSITSKSLC